MSPLLHQYRNALRLYAEHRLVFKVAGVEGLGKETANTLTTDETIRELSKDVTEERLNELSGSLKEKFQNDEQKIEDALQTMERTAPTENAEKKALIEYNMLRLRERIGIGAQTETQKEMLKNSIARKKETVEAAKNPLTIRDRVNSAVEQLNNGAVSVTDNLLPASLTKEWTREGKMTAGYVMGAGIGVVTITIARWLWRKGSNAFAAGKNAAEQTGGSWLKKAAIAAAVGTAAFLGYKYFKGELTAEKITDAAKKGFEKAKEEITEKKKAVTDALHPWNAVGLEEESYNRAKEIYLSQRDEGEADIKKIFNLKGDETNDQYEKFMEKMAKDNPEYTKNGITYVRADNALDSYKANLGNAIGTLRDMSEARWAEILGTTAVLSYFNVITLKTILSSTESVFVIAKNLAAFLLSCGGKIARNPIISLFLVGGACGTLYGASKTQFMPKNLGELSKASKTNQKIIQGKSGTDTIDSDEMETALRKNASKLEGIEEDTDSWIQTKINDLIAILKEKASNGFVLTMGETIEGRTAKGIKKLTNHLERKLSSALYSGKAVENKKVAKYRAAIEKLAAFEEAYIQHRCGTDLTSTLPEAEYVALTALLTDKDIGIGMGIEKDIVWWNDASREEKWSMCVDPSIKDQNKIHKISWNMRQDESDASFSVGRMIELMRENTAPVVQATGGAGSELLKIGSEGKDALVREGGRIAEFFRECGERDVSGAIGTFFSAGGGLIWEGGGLVAFIGKEMVSVPSSTALKVMGFLDTKKDENIAMLWGASGVAYFVGKSTYNLIMAGKYSGIAPMSLKELGWAAIKMAPGPFAAVTDNLGNIRRIGSKEGREILKMRYISQTTPAAIARWFGDVFGKEITTSQGMERAIKRWNQLRKELNLMKATHRNKFGRTYTEVEIENQKILIEKQVEKIKNGLEEMAKGDIDAIQSPMIRQVIEENLQGLGNPNDFAVKMDEVQIKYKKAFISPSLTEEGATPKTSIIPDDLEFKQPETPTSSTTESSPQNKPSSTEDVVSSGPAVNPAEAAKQAARAEKVEKVLKINRIAKVLEGIQDPNQLAKIREILNALSPEELDAILKSRKAVNLLKGSLQAAATTGNAVELTHIVTAAKNAQVLRVRIGAGWNGVGVVGDLFGAYMAYCDWQANHDRITSTDNPALKELYSTANYLYAAEGGSSVAGIVLGGISFLPSTSTVSVALGAPTGFVMLPIAALVLAARETHKGLEKSSEYHLLDERDLLKQYSPGQILQHISSTTPLSNLNWQQNWFLNADSAREGNEGARNEGYRAYFAQVAAATLPPVDAADADVDTTMSDEQKQSAIDTLQRERTSGFVYDAMAYIAYKTDKEFTIATPEVLHNAALYAEMQFDARENGEQTKSPAADDKAYWINMDTVISERALGSYKKITESISKSSKDAELFEEDLPAKLLYLLRDDLAVCELKILATDYSNWSTWSAWAQWKGEDQMRSVARGIFAEQTWDVLHAAVSKVRAGTELKPADIDTVLADIKKVLRQNPDSVARNTLKTASNVSYFEKIGALGTRLTAPGMQDLMRMYTLSKPTALRVNQSKAFSMKSLEYHYKDLLSHKNKHPIELIVPAGSSAGYLQIDEPLWMSDGGANNYKPVGYSEGSAILKLEAGHYYSFRRQASMQVRDDYEAEDTWEPKNGVGPDIEIITIDPTAPKEKQEEVVTPNPNGPSF